MPDCIECKNYFEFESAYCKECSGNGNLSGFVEAPNVTPEQIQDNIVYMNLLNTKTKADNKNQIVKMFERQYRQGKKCDIPEYKQWQAAWMVKFQHNEYAKQWPKIRDGLLKAFVDNNTKLVKDCFWASLIASEFNPDKLPAIVIWGMKRACSIANNQDIYERLSVKLNVADICGETFYAGFPSPTGRDLILGQLLNTLDLYGG